MEDIELTLSEVIDLFGQGHIDFIPIGLINGLCKKCNYNINMKSYKMILAPDNTFGVIGNCEFCNHINRVTLHWRNEQVNIHKMEALRLLIEIEGGFNC